MRWNDLSHGSIKTFLILGLLLANIAVSFSHRRVDAQPPESARASRAAFGDSPNARATSGKEKPGKTAGEARALPEQPPR